MRVVLALLFSFSAQLMAQQIPTQKPSPPSVCANGKFRQFDFWIGDWSVSEQGQVAGSNAIRKVLDGCALQENWQGAGPGGLSGSSLNAYNQATDSWHQTWVDSNGTLLQLDGGMRQGSMVLEGQRPSADGLGMTTHRISWTQNADGSVRQLWEANSDGENWTVLFDGLYQRVLESPQVKIDETR